MAHILRHFLIWSFFIYSIYSANVVVIGAGMSGISAATKLREEGHAVTILEGRNRIGGRIFTDRSLGFPIDFGAAWCHGDKPNPVKYLAEDYSIPLKPTPQTFTRFKQNGSIYTQEMYDASWEIYSSFKKSIIRHAKKGQSWWEVGQLLNTTLMASPDIQFQMSEDIEFDTSAGEEQLSAVSYSQDEEFSGPDYLFPNGYDKLLEAMLGDSSINEVSLNHIVTAITQNSNGVVVDYTNALTEEQGSVTADVVVVTVPLGVLAKGNITFTPSLSQSKAAAFKFIQLGVVDKIAAQFPFSFWKFGTTWYDIDSGITPTTRGLLSEYADLGLWNSDPGNRTLLGLSFALSAVAMEHMSDEEIKTEVVRKLGLMFKISIPEILKFKAVRWSMDPFAYGSYSYVTTSGHQSMYDDMARPEGKIFFAGEHTCKIYRGTVHGAYLSGQEAANRVIEYLTAAKPKSSKAKIVCSDDI
eukprot:TRINITY_DN11539_c0_g1_i1.p1 TRINITY_DN11539_c0_g1~~TRINITY_DN11539_c0_g1_i1.p1  ORF type:complete len:469 (-),score=73.60 TRINITY_DN11539_c0_g1_i1:272-1678(-)